MENKLLKAMQERMNNIQEQLNKCMEHKLEEIQQLDNEIEETVKIIETNMQMINDIESQITLMNILKSQLLEQKKGLLAENEDKMLELKELQDRRAKDKLGKYITNIVMPNEKDNEEIEQVATMEEMTLNMSIETLENIKSIINDYKKNE